MFIAQIKASIHHALSCAWSGSVCRSTVRCSLGGCLKVQKSVVILSRGPAEEMP